MGSQLLGIGGVVAGHMGNDRQLALGLCHHIFQHQLALLLAVVDALTGGAAHIQALHTLVDKPAGQFPDTGGIDGTVCVIASVKRGKNALILGKVFHVTSPFPDWFLFISSRRLRLILILKRLHHLFPFVNPFMKIVFLFSQFVKIISTRTKNSASFFT